MLVLCIVIFCLLVTINSIKPQPVQLSQFELKRLAGLGSSDANTILRRQRLLVDATSLQRQLSILLLVLSVLSSVAALAWLGLLLGIVIIFVYERIASMIFISQFTTRYYERYESLLLNFIERYQSYLHFFYVTPPQPDVSKLHSREEITHLIAGASFLSSYEKKLIAHGLMFTGRKVSEVMMVRIAIKTVSKGEVLGPLVLDDLHKTGHHIFPVIDGDIDHVVGMLDIRSHLELGVTKSPAAGKAMESRVFYIHEDENLVSALASFLRTGRTTMIVVNITGETVGMVSLADVIETLFGHKIVDDFDNDDNLQAVASRRSN